MSDPPEDGEPTEAMVEAGRAAALAHYSSAPISDEAYRKIYRAMRSASPPVDQGRVEKLEAALEQAAEQLDACADMLEYRHVEPRATRAAARVARAALTNKDTAS